MIWRVRQQPDVQECGFQPRGAVNHPEDGLFWLWELPIRGSD
jgi:hypothetical protein